VLAYKQQTNRLKNALNSGATVLSLG
jgi:hypothetical protein